jgi:K+-sensing histidine kinase KdpD
MVILSVVAACLDYFFTEPRFSMRIDASEDVMAVAAFATTSFVTAELVEGAQIGRSGGAERSASNHHRHNTSGGLEQFARRLDQLFEHSNCRSRKEVGCFHDVVVLSL